MDDEAVHFKVKPEYKILYFDVFIWKSPAAMHRNLLGLHGVGGWRQTVGAFLVPPIADRKRNCLGEIHLNEKHLDHDTVAHEAQHAALWWAKHIKLPIGDIFDPEAPHAGRVEERFCEGLGAIVHQMDLVLKSENYFKEKKKNAA